VLNVGRFPPGAGGGTIQVGGGVPGGGDRGERSFWESWTMILREKEHVLRWTIASQKTIYQNQQRKSKEGSRERKRRTGGGRECYHYFDLWKNP